MGKQYLFCFAPNCKHGAANGPVKVLKSNAKSLLKWSLKSNPHCGKVCQNCYNEDLRARKAAEERLAASATRSNAAALKSAGGSVQQQKPQRAREATNDSASESVDSQPTKKSRGENDGQDDDRMMISKAEEEEEEGEGRRGHHFNAASDGSANDIIIDGDSRPTGSLTTTANRATGIRGETNSWKTKGGLTEMSSDENSSDLAESVEEQDGLHGKGDKRRTQGACCQVRPEGRCRAHSPVGGDLCCCRCRVSSPQHNRIQKRIFTAANRRGAIRPGIGIHLQPWRRPYEVPVAAFFQ